MNSPEIDCNHDHFKKGICTECGWECEHGEIEDNICLDCGEYIVPNYPEPDDMSAAHAESESRE